MALSTIDPLAALVVIDLQNGVVGTPTAPQTAREVVDRTVVLADAFRARGLPVVLVRVSTDGAGFSPGRTEHPIGGGSRPEGWDRIVEELAGHPEDVVVTKRTIGAFFGTDLDLQLRRRGVTQVVLTGVATTMGVEGTARAAHDHGYHVVVVTDATADRDDDAHRYSVTTIVPRIGETASTDEVLTTLATTHDAVGTGR